jgi:predicted LPLAT superfamily acyltransferase
MFPPWAVARPGVRTSCPDAVAEGNVRNGSRPRQTDPFMTTEKRRAFESGALTRGMVREERPVRLVRVRSRSESLANGARSRRLAAVPERVSSLNYMEWSTTDSRSQAPVVSPTSERTEHASVTLWERISFTAIHAAAAIGLGVLSLGGMYVAARWFGTAEWLVNYRRRRRFADLLRQVWGREPSARERRRATRAFFIRSRWDRLFYLVFDRIPRAQAMSLLRIGNRELLDAAVAHGKGVYVALSHHGAHHVIGMLMCLHGYRVAGVRDRREGGLRRWVRERYDRKYPEFRRARILYSDSYPRDIYRCLQDGYLLGSAMDVGRVRHPNQKTEEVSVFGERHPFLTGPLRIAVRCRVPILQAFIIPDGTLGYRLDFLDLQSDPGRMADEEATVAATIRAYAANVEQYVRESPWLVSRI